MTIVILAFLVRSSVRSLLNGPVRRWKVGPGGVEAEYWNESVEEAVEQLPPPADGGERAQLDSGLASELAPLMESAPRAAVLEAFIRVEQALREIVLAEPALLDPARGKVTSASQLAGIALRAGRIDGNTPAAIAGLSVLRNVAAHQRDGIGVDQAREFVLGAEAVLAVLNELPR